MNTPQNLPPERLFELRKELLIVAQQKQYEYGKWLLASLLAVHLGGLFVISQAGEIAPRLFQASGACLIYGVATALLSGGLAWINFTVSALLYAKSLSALVEGNDNKPATIYQVLILATFWTTPVLVTISLVLFFIAAHRSLAIL